MKNTKVLGIEFPEKIGLFDLGEVINNESTKKGAGFTVPYNTESAKATIYLYDKGIGSIPDRPTTEVVLVEFNQAIKELIYFITEYEKSEIKLLDKFGTGSPQSGPEFYCAEFLVKANNLEHRADLYMGASKGHFVKLRITYSAGTTDFSTSRQFADQIGKIIY